MIYNLLALLPIVAHLVLAAYICGKISKSILLTKKQKRLNIFLSILVPFVWPVLMYYILKKEPNYFDKRKRITNDKWMIVEFSG
nr:hypothetical protein [uncultured Mucilaginibacter sp.]